MVVVVSTPTITFWSKTELGKKKYTDAFLSLPFVKLSSCVLAM